MTDHYVKCFSPRFELLLTGKISADVRFNDRLYIEGDEIVFREGSPCFFNGFEYTGRTLRAKITHVDSYGVLTGFVTLSLKFTGKH